MRTLKEQLKANDRATRAVQKALNPSRLAIFPQRRDEETAEERLARLLKHPLWKGSSVDDTGTRYIVTHPTKKARMELFKDIGAR